MKGKFKQNEQPPLTSMNAKKSTMKYVIENPGPGLGQT